MSPCSPLLSSFLFPPFQLCLTDNKVSKRPRRPYEKERLDAELKLVGEFGLKNKKELYRVNLALSKIRKAARILLTMPEKDPRRIFQVRRHNRLTIPSCTSVMHREGVGAP